MRFGKGWSRRRFLAVSSAAAAQAAAGFKGLGRRQASAGRCCSGTASERAEAARAMPPPGVITGGIQPLMESMTRAAFALPAGGRRVRDSQWQGVLQPAHLWRQLADAVGDFRVDAGDLPEFSMYLPGHGGNFKLGIIGADGAAIEVGRGCR